MRVLVSVLFASTLVAARTAAQSPPAQPTRPVVRPALPAPPADPVVDNWRGTLTSASGTESPIIITIVKKGDGYAGSTNGLNASSESPLKRVTVNGTKLSVEATDDCGETL